MKIVSMEVNVQSHYSIRTESYEVPRNEDRVLTGKVRDELALFGIQLLDHIFVSRKDSYSLAEYELL